MGFISTYCLRKTGLSHPVTEEDTPDSGATATNSSLRATFINAGSEPDASGIYNVGSDDVPSLRQAYQYVIQRASTRARVAEPPQRLNIFGMRSCTRLGLSPLGPYQYRMIAQDFVFDITKVKTKLGWHSTQRNDELRSGTDLSAQRQPAKLGVIRVLKWIS